MPDPNDPTTPKNPITVMVEVPPGTQLPPRLRQLLGDLAQELQQYPEVVQPELGCVFNSRCGVLCGVN
jgi:hypothetical protein